MLTKESTILHTGKNILSMYMLQSHIWSNGHFRKIMHEATDAHLRTIMKQIDLYTASILTFVV